MEKLEKKTTVLFPPELFRQLEKVGKAKRLSVGELIRRAVRQQYQISEIPDRLKAVDRLSQIETPVSGWEKIEDEIQAGAAEK
jgi:hypothetical protein